jgi:predicted nucleotidyltransferase
MQALTVQHQLSVATVVDQIVNIVLVTFEKRIVSIYLGGSLSRGQMTVYSDIDMTVVFSGTVSNLDYERFMKIREALQALSPFRLDMWPVSEEKLKSRPANQSVRQSRCIYGEPFLTHVPAQTIEAFAMQSIHKAIHYMTVLRGRPNPNPAPLNYPDEQAPFFGYTQFGDFDGDNAFKPGTRILVDLITRCTTAVVAAEHSIEANTKSESLQLYQMHVGGQWTSYMNEGYQLIRDELHYQLPTTPDQQARLTAVCETLLAFENDMLNTFKPIIINRLQSDDRRQRKLALVALKNIQFADADVRQALHAYPYDDADHLLNSVRKKYEQSPKD